MSAAMILKIFSDCCICFAILAAGPLECELPLLVPAVICGIAAGIATFFEKKGWSALRRICCVLPLLCLLLAENTGHGIVLAVPAVYTAIVIAKGELALEYSSYRHFFVRSLMLLGGVLVVAYIWTFLTQITAESVLQLSCATIIRYGLVHLLCGVVLQRQLRLGIGYRAEGGRRQMGMLLGTAGTIAVGFAAAEPLLRRGMGKVLEYALTIVLAPFVFIFETLWNLLGRDKSQKADRVYQEFLDYMDDVLLGGRDPNQGQTGQPSTQTEFDPAVLWTVLAGILLLIAAILLLRSFRKQSKDGGVGELSSRLVTVPKKKKSPVFSNRTRVRQTYREFLRVERDLGMKLQPSNTTQDVQDRLHPNTHRPSAEQLRQVYLAVRYDDRQTVTRAQVDAAKQALRGSRRQKG